MYIPPHTDFENIVKYARLVNETPDTDMASIENYFSHLTDSVKNMAGQNLTSLINTVKTFNFSRKGSGKRNYLDLKHILSTGKPYLSYADAIVTRPSGFIGNLSIFAGIYYPGSDSLSVEYIPLLEGYQSHLVNAARKGSDSHSSHPAMMDRYLKSERKFNTEVHPYFKGGARDITTLRQLLPNETACIAFNELVKKHDNHPLLQLKFLGDLEARLSVAATVLENFKAENKGNPKLYKSLARDAFSLAEIANTLVGRAYTIQQTLKVHEEAIAIITDVSSE